MHLKSVTYTSLGRLDLTSRDVSDIHKTAMRLNALVGVTGLLIFNGSRFLQIIEGPQQAIDALIERLRRDDRHSAFELRDSRFVACRAFPDWSMELLQVSAGQMLAGSEIEAKLPTDLPPEIRALIQNMARKIATPLSMPE